MNYPYGRAPLAILILTIVAGLGIWVLRRGYDHEIRPDLIFATHARLHADVYRARLPEFERRYGVKVQIQEVEYEAMRTRLQAAFLAGTAVPDLVEIPENIAFFSRGPLRDMGLLDLTDWIKEEKLDQTFIPTRFSAYSTRGHIYALPHDVHPMMLAYRADIVEDQFGYNMDDIKTWDDFVTMARKLTADLDGDGTIDRYALELQVTQFHTFTILMLQRGLGLFNEQGEVSFDDPGVVDLVIWYLQQLYGPHRISFDPDNGQPLWRAMSDGLILFFFTPDWRTRYIEQYAPDVAGKMKLMPLPAWTEGGRRTSTWGSTGLAIPKQSPNIELAKKLAKFLYVEQSDEGASAYELRILPPAKSAWSGKALQQSNPFFRGQPIMQLYAEMAPDVPPVWSTPYTEKARGKLNESFLICAEFYRQHGESGLRDFTQTELTRTANYIREIMARNQFLTQ